MKLQNKNNQVSGNTQLFLFYLLLKGGVYLWQIKIPRKKRLLELILSTIEMERFIMPKIMATKRGHSVNK